MILGGTRYVGAQRSVMRDGSFVAMTVAHETKA